MSGWIKLHRKFSDWGWFQDSKMVHLFIHLLMSANFLEKKKWRNIMLNKGQLITGRKLLSEETGISEQSIRTCLNNLKSTNEITIKSTSRFSVITICNYEQYQLNIKDVNQVSNQQSTSNQPATNHNKEVKKEKKNILFKNSEINDFDKFKEALTKYAGGKYRRADMDYYYETVRNWSESGGNVKKDWVATTAGFILKDIKENKFKT